MGSTAVTKACAAERPELGMEFRHSVSRRNTSSIEHSVIFPPLCGVLSFLAHISYYADLVQHTTTLLPHHDAPATPSFHLPSASRKDSPSKKEIYWKGHLTLYGHIAARISLEFSV